MGSPVTGTDAVTEITDIWTFERDLAAARPGVAPGCRPQRVTCGSSSGTCGWLCRVTA